MTAVARNQAMAAQARRIYVEALVQGMVGLGQAINEAAAQLQLQSAEYAVMVARRDGVQSWNRHGPAWQAGVISGLRHAAVYGIIDSHGGSAQAGALGAAAEPPTSKMMALVDDDIIEREITASRLALAMMDKATWEFTDLRTRLQQLEQQDDLPRKTFCAPMWWPSWCWTHGRAAASATPTGRCCAMNCMRSSLRFWARLITR